MDNKINNNDAKNNIPWIEKYRPNNFDDIVLDPINRKIFDKILEKKYFPNLLFYGPPGTGKTTTIINLINNYQKQNNELSRGTVIHLNASDERGIDIIRNQIYQFVKSRNLFEKGIKFVILDEVDYMTKNAQQALKYLLQFSSNNVRFCLICNYISKIDESLNNEFLAIRFNQLPKKEIDRFLKNICQKEDISLSDYEIDTIQQLYKYDIRSMINFIQLNQRTKNWNNIISDDVYKHIHELLLHHNSNSSSISSTLLKDDITTFLDFFHKISIQYNKDKLNILKNYFNYIIRKKPECITPYFLNISEFILHNIDTPLDDILKYLYYHFLDSK